MAVPIEAVLESVQQLKGVFDQLSGTIKPFVEALSPSTVQAFNQAMRDVQATIGSAVVSSLQVFSSVLREIGGVILPLMQKLEPILRSLATSFGGVLVGVVRVLVAVLESLIPVFQILADAMASFAGLLVDMTGLLVAVIKTLSAVSGLGDQVGAFKEAFKGLADTVRQVVKALATFIATLLVGIGQRDLVARFAKTLQQEAKDREERTSGLKAAATNPAIADIQSVNKQQQLAAFTAAGGGAAREKTDTEYLRDIATTLADTAATKKSFGEALHDWWETEVVGGPGILGRVLRFFEDTYRDFKRGLEVLGRLGS